MKPASRRSPRAALLLLATLTLFATACGGGSGEAEITAPAPLTDGDGTPAAPATPGNNNGIAVAGTVDPDAAQAAADANIGALRGSDDVRLIEVLNVADGSVATLDDAVVGDRPVLLWFWAPH